MSNKNHKGISGFQRKEIIKIGSCDLDISTASQPVKEWARELAKRANAKPSKSKRSVRPNEKTGSQKRPQKGQNPKTNTPKGNTIRATNCAKDLKKSPQPKPLAIGDAKSNSQYRIDFPTFFVDEFILANALEKDAGVFSSDQRKYCEENCFQYTVLIELWLELFSVFTQPMAFRRLGWLIANDGLIGTIKLADQCASIILSLSAVTSFTISECKDRLAANGFAQILPDVNDTSVLLELCRFPKRFSPKGADKILTAACESFCDLQSRLSRRNWDHSFWYECFPEDVKSIAPLVQKDFKWWKKPTYKPDDLLKNYGRSIYSEKFSGSFEETRLLRELCDRISYHISYMVPNWDCAEWARRSYLLGGFSNGASQQGKELVKKVNAFANTYSQLYGVPLVPTPKGKPFDVDEYVATVKPVPKSWKAPRLIAPEHAVANWWLTGARIALYEFFPCKKCFDAENQDINRDACKTASLGWFDDVVYATVDQTSASDSISTYIAHRVFPEGLLEFIDRFRAKKFVVGDTVSTPKPLATFLTSGNPLTFILEGIFFLALARAAEDFVRPFISDSEPTLLPTLIFGDDTLIDSRVYATFCDFSEYIGLTINDDKSFAGGSRVKESCGVEYLEGVSTRSIYWPRTEIDKGTESLLSLISLQQRLFEICPEASATLASIIRTIAPVTGTKPAPEYPWGETYGLDQVTDLIEPNPKVYTTLAPHRGPLNVPEEFFPYIQREKHTVSGIAPSEPIYSNNVDAYLYAMFLREGPQYEDALSRLLNVSLPTSKVGAVRLPKTVLSKKER